MNQSCFEQTGIARKKISLRSKTSFNKIKLGEIHRKHKIIVSLTSFPARIRTIHLVFERIFKQTLLADEVHLYLSKLQFPLLEKDLTNELLGYRRLGLHIKWVEEDIRPHKKYYYVMQTNPEDLIITIDDDLIYDLDLIEKLYLSYLDFPHAVSAMRTHLITFDEKNSINPYRQWKNQYSGLISEPSMLLFSTSGAGTLYPPKCMHKELFNMQNIVELCVNADDLWLKVMQIMNNTPTVLVQPCKRLVYVDGTQEVSLKMTNMYENENDIQLKAIIDSYNKYFGECNTLLSRIISNKNANEKNSINDKGVSRKVSVS